MPPLPCFCFCLCKITVVQVSSRRRHVDGKARKRTAKRLCSPQRSFLSYNRLSCPERSFGFTARPSSVGRLHLPSRARRTAKGAFQDDRLPLSKGGRGGLALLADSSVSREIATGTWRGQTGRGGGGGEKKSSRGKRLRFHAREKTGSSLGFQM